MPNRPQPRFPEPNTEPYWEGVKARELRYQGCNACDEVVFTPRLHCTSCGSADLEWRTSAGEGAVYTYSVVRQNRNPRFADLGAYAVAYVDLDEGFRISRGRRRGSPRSRCSSLRDAARPEPVASVARCSTWATARRSYR